MSDQGPFLVTHVYIMLLDLLMTFHTYITHVLKYFEEPSGDASIGNQCVLECITKEGILFPSNVRYCH